MAKSDRVQAACSCCGNVSGYDRETLKGSTMRINGVKIVLCCPCEDDLLVKLAARRRIGIRLGDGGEIGYLSLAMVG